MNKNHNKIIFLVFLFSVITASVPFSKALAQQAVTPDSQNAPGFTFTFKDQKFELKKEDVDSWKGQETISSSKILNSEPESLQSSVLGFVGNNQIAQDIKIYNYKINKIYDYIKSLADKINVVKVDPTLKIEGALATEFTPPQNGESVDVYKTTIEALNTLQINRGALEITVYQTQPETQLSQTNNLGINELIASGVSSFAGSPNNRRHNIAIGVEKFKGLIINPGEEFSFNKNLGPVEAAEGFLPELVIKKSGTVPELGGGLCQVSSTTFRAAMQAGLPITQRKNHAYAVQYYSPQGTDATIYPGVIDLKFINDTPGAILIWPYLKDKNTLIFDFYGTPDNRKVTLEKPVVYDRQTDGAMKATWTRIVEKDGNTRTDVFKSNYQSPALFHKTEQFVTASSSPASSVTPATLH